MNRAQRRKHKIREDPVLKRAKKYAYAEAIDFLYSVAMGVLKDDFGFDLKKLQKFYDRMEYHGDSIAKGYTKVTDYRQMLKDEAGVIIKPAFYRAEKRGSHDTKRP